MHGMPHDLLLDAGYDSCTQQCMIYSLLSGSGILVVIVRDAYDERKALARPVD